MSIYDNKPDRFLLQRHSESTGNPASDIYCAGFELEVWRCLPFAHHLVEWLPDYALAEEDLRTHHGNAYVKLRQAAVRVYTSEKYKKRGEAGEIALHAICRDYFETTPISPRVFYKSTSNDVIKSFDLVHARFPDQTQFQIWLGESKLYKKPDDAISDAIKSIKDHIAKGFLENQKLLLGPQIPKNTPRYSDILKIFKTQTSIDDFLAAAVFVVGIACDSDAAKAAKKADDEYIQAAISELRYLAKRLSNSGLSSKLKLVLIYIPLADKDGLVTAFDAKLKALQ